MDSPAYERSMIEDMVMIDPSTHGKQHVTKLSCKVMTIRLLLAFLASTSLLIAGLETYSLVRSHYDVELPSQPFDAIVRASDFANITSTNSSLTCTAEDSILIPESDKRVSICSSPTHKIRIDFREFRKGKPSWMGLQISPRELRQFELSLNKIWWYITKHQSRLDSFNIRYHTKGEGYETN